MVGGVGDEHVLQLLMVCPLPQNPVHFVAQSSIVRVIKEPTDTREGHHQVPYNTSALHISW